MPKVAQLVKGTARIPAVAQGLIAKVIESAPNDIVI